MTEDVASKSRRSPEAIEPTDVEWASLAARRGQTVQGCVLEAGEAESASRNGELVLSLLCVELGELNEFERHDTNPQRAIPFPHEGLTKFWYETTLAGRCGDLCKAGRSPERTTGRIGPA